MVRAKALFSILALSVLSSACSKGGSPGKTTPANQQAKLNGSGLMDSSLSKDQGSVQNSGSKTVRAQKVEDLPAENDSQTLSPSAAPAPTDNSNYSQYNYDDETGTASVKPGMVAETPWNIDPLERQKAQAEVQAETQPETPAASPSSADAPASVPSSDDSADSSAQPDTNDQPPVSATDTPTNSDTTIVSVGVAPSTDSALNQFAAISPEQAGVTRADDPQWMPGLPHDPAAKPVVTFGTRGDGASYTDGKLDSVMSVLWNDYNSNPDLLKGNEEIASQIRDVHIVGSQNGDVTAYTLAVNVDEDGNWTQLVFHGTRDVGTIKAALHKAKAEKTSKSKSQRKGLAHKAAASRTFVLAFDTKSKSQAPLKYKYRATAHCSDKSFLTCDNVALEVKRYDLHAKRGTKPLAVAFIVHRQGSAIVTFDMKDQGSSAARQAFDQFLAASGKNALMQTWAVAGGPSKYEVILGADKDPNDLYFKKALVISGQLVTVSDKSEEPANVTDGSKDARDAWFKDKRMQLVSNDGGGDLNLKVSFSDANESERISVSSNFALTRAPVLTKKSKK